MLRGMAEPEGLRAAISRVDEELERSQRLDPDTRERVRAALAEIHAALDAERAPREDHQNDLVELVEQFAEDHPTLSAALGRLADSLSKLGI